MRIGLVSDIHGNRVALDAVVTDGVREGVDRWWVLGDLVAIGPEPVRTLELLVDLPRMSAVKGNTERYVLTDDRPPPHPADVVARPALLEVYAAIQRSFAWTCGALAAHGWLGWLSGVPSEKRAVLPDGTRVLGVHASPTRDDGEGLTPHRDQADLGRDLEGAGADLVVAGHTHQPTDRWVGGVRAVNPGSVSNPVTDDLRASYVIVHADRHGHHLQHRRVAYDHRAVLDAIARSGHPAADYIASFQRGEQVRYPALRPGAPTTSTGSG